MLSHVQCSALWLVHSKHSTKVNSHHCSGLCVLTCAHVCVGTEQLPASASWMDEKQTALADKPIPLPRISLPQTLPANHSLKRALSLEKLQGLFSPGTWLQGSQPFLCSTSPTHGMREPYLGPSSESTKEEWPPWFLTHTQTPPNCLRAVRAQGWQPAQTQHRLGPEEHTRDQANSPTPRAKPRSLPARAPRFHPSHSQPQVPQPKGKSQEISKSGFF